MSSLQQNDLAFLSSFALHHSAVGLVTDCESCGGAVPSQSTAVIRMVMKASPWLWYVPPRMRVGLSTKLIFQPASLLLVLPVVPSAFDAL